MTYRQLFSYALQYCSKFDARQLFNHVYNTDLFNVFNDIITDEILSNRFLEYCKKRQTGYPLQYIIGEWEFYGFPFKVGEGVLIPREDTMILVDAAISVIKSSDVVFDICSGSGCIAVSLAKKQNCKMFALELSDTAYKYLTENIRLNNADVTAIHTDALDYIHDDRIDVIISNPPYIKSEDISLLQKEVLFEPKLALDGSSDGLHFYRKLTSHYKHMLNSDAHIIYEVGFDQADDVADILCKNDFADIRFFQDLGGIRRVVSGRYHGCSAD